MIRAFSRLLLVLLISACLPSGAAQAQTPAQAQLQQFLSAFNVEEVFPGADRLGPVEGAPPAAAAFSGQTLRGYVFVNSDLVASIGYSGKPIHIAVGVSTGGEIVGMKLLKHSEPIVLIGIPEQRIRDAIASLVGYNVLQQSSRQKPPVDIISGATVTIVVMGESITRGALKLLRSRASGAAAAAAPEEVRRSLDPARTGRRSWEELLGDGSIRRLHLSVADVNAAFEQSGDERAKARPERGAPDDTFIELFVAPVSVPVIGASLLGEGGYAALRQELGPDRHAMVVMGQGIYSFRGSGYVRGGIFDRIELIQGDASIRFRDKDYDRLGDVAAEGSPHFPEIGLFRIPPGVSFAPTQPWRLQLLVARAVSALDKAFLTFDLPYELPELYLSPLPPPAPAAVAAAQTAAAPPPAIAGEAEEAEEPLWQRIWRDRTLDIAITSIALGLLTAIFFFQDFLVRRPRLLKWVRLSFLAWTLLWLGWFANAQLSVVNILTIANSLITNFSWDFFLMDPLLFVLWSAVAAALLFWGRGAFCGWLCPYGALQEFANLLGRRLKVPQINVPWGLHERLWPIKYIIFLGLFALSLYSLSDAEKMAEVEPFKTAIILKFAREWPFALYAGGLVLASMTIERFFCRYICPLGAALAIPARLRMFEWLKRHRECGNPCQRCANECPVQSIHPDGRINPNECIYCMHCQELYWDEHRCPHMIQIRLRRERQEAMSGPPRKTIIGVSRESTATAGEPELKRGGP